MGLARIGMNIPDIQIKKKLKTKTKKAPDRIPFTTTGSLATIAFTL